MFGFFKTQPQGDQLTVKVHGMHCSSCAMNIDDALEELDGVFSATTSYARSTVQIAYDSSKVSPKELLKVIEEQGYEVN